MTIPERLAALRRDSICLYEERWTVEMLVEQMDASMNYGREFERLQLKEMEGLLLPQHLISPPRRSEPLPHRVRRGRPSR